MSFFKASVFTALVAAVSALQVTAPAKDAKVDLSKDTTVSWSSVSSDPSSFSIVLVNQAVNPSVSINIADNVETSSGSYKVPAQDGVTEGGSYQFNLVSKATQNEGILAQSQQFEVTGSGSASSSSSSAAASSASSASSSASSAKAAASSTLSAASSSAAAAASSASAAVSSAASSASAAVKSATASATSASASGNGAASLHLASGVAGLGLVGAVVALFA